MKQTVIPPPLGLTSALSSPAGETLRDVLGFDNRTLTRTHFYFYFLCLFGHLMFSLSNITNKFIQTSGRLINETHLG